MKKQIKTTLLTALFSVILFLTSCSGSGPELGIGLQLYSVRDDMRNDPVATVEKVGQMGYDFVEAAGYGAGKFYGMDPVEFRELVEKNGMVFRGSHTGQSVPDSGGWEQLMPWWDECIAAHKSAGVEYIVQPSMGNDAFTSLEVLAQYCAYFNAVGEKCNAEGIRFGFHNHNREFSSIDGQVIYDYMLDNTDPDKVMFQLDLYWINEGKGDVAAYVEKYPGRFVSFHIKDEMELGESGKMDFKALLALSEAAGVKYQVVEVERYNFEPLESVEKSLDYLKEIGFVK